MIMRIVLISSPPRTPASGMLAWTPGRGESDGSALYLGRALLKALPDMADQPAARSAIGKCFSFLRLSHFLTENRVPLFREMHVPCRISLSENRYPLFREML